MTLQEQIAEIIQEHDLDATQPKADYEQAVREVSDKISALVAALLVDAAARRGGVRL